MAASKQASMYVNTLLQCSPTSVARSNTDCITVHVLHLTISGIVTPGLVNGVTVNNAKLKDHPYPSATAVVGHGRYMLLKVG